MTAVDQSPPRSGRVRNLRDDLLDDLRQAAPMPATTMPATTMPAAQVPAAPKPATPLTPAAPMPAAPLTPVVSMPGLSLLQPAGRAEPSGTWAPTLEVRLTPRLWRRPRLETLGEEPGLVLTVGPVQISVTGFRR